MKLKSSFLRLLRTDPEFYEEVRRVILTDELLSLPALVRELAQAVRESTERTDRLTEQVGRLTENMERWGARVDQLTENMRQLTTRVDQLTENMRQLTARVDQLTENMRPGSTHGQLTARVNQLTEDVRQLTARVDQLTGRVDQLTENMRQLTARVDQLTEDVRQLTARVDQLTGRVDQLAEDLRQLTARVDQLTVRLDQLTEEVRQLTRNVQNLTRQVGRLTQEVGGFLEIKYRQHPYGYFGMILRRPRWVAGDELETLLDEALQAGRISEKDLQVLMLTDLIVRGVRQGRTTWLAVEVSGTIDREDIQRALERAILLSRCVSDEVIPVVAGIHCPEDVRDGALRTGVWVIQDGQVFAPAPQETER
jgi:outer membrane murein-binding lipoprotein Lpp